MRKRRDGKNRGGLVAFRIGVAVDNGFAQKIEQSRRAILSRHKLQQTGRGVDERCRRIAAPKLCVGDHVFDKRDVGFDAANTKLAQRPIHAIQRGLESLRAHRHFHQKRIVERRDDKTRARHAAVESNAETARAAIRQNLAVIGREAVFRIFSRDARLDGETVARHVVLLRNRNGFVVQIVALRDENLRAHNVDSGDDFGHSVFDLNARIHLDEEPVVGIDIE